MAINLLYVGNFKKTLEFFKTYCIILNSKNFFVISFVTRLNRRDFSFIDPKNPKTTATELRIEYRKYATFLLKIRAKEELLKTIRTLSNKGILFSSRPEISAIAGVVCSIEEFNFLKDIFPNNSIYFGIPSEDNFNSIYPIIYICQWDVIFSSPQMVAASRALKHNFASGKIYYLTIDQNPNVKNGKLTEIGKEKLYNYLPYSFDYNNHFFVPKLVLSSFEIGKDYILVSIDQNRFTHRVFDIKAIIEMSKFNFRLWETIFNSIPPDLKVFLLNLTGDYIDILVPSFALKILQSLLIKELNEQPIKVTAVPLSEQKRIICNTSSPAPVVFCVFPSLSKEIALTAELQKYHQKKVRAMKWTAGVIALPQDLYKY
ncbi:MAG: hypothetical protein KatS3mg090_0489 [Patescibacteria group bacterium]|nr:MAG: hypothetical protein KatS3mg090_0489 [Patescibacteria group bacterium]